MSAEAIRRADAAARIMADPMVIEALAAIKANVRDLFFELGSEQAQQREMLHLMDRARQQFEHVFALHIQGGEVSRHDLLNDAKLRASMDAIRSSAIER